MRSRVIVLSCLMMVVLGATSASAQLSREDDTWSVAGVLTPMSGFPLPVAEWYFKSGGGEVLYATLDAHTYLVRGGHHEEVAVTAEEEPGGCEGGGPGFFYLAVIAPDGTEICRAERPAPPPGWQRDPRMACVLPEVKGQATYVLRVGLLGTDEEPQAAYPFLLNVSLRGLAPEGVSLQEAVARSRNRF